MTQMKRDGSLRRRFKQWLQLSACAAGILSAVGPQSVHASGVVRDSVGATSSGRGGTNIAAFDNGPVLLSNPAGIVNIQSPQLFELGVDTVITDLDYRDPENPGATDMQAGPLPQLTYIKASEDKLWAAGIGVYAPAGYSADWDLNHPLLGPARSYSSYGALVKVIPGVAVHVTEQLSVGATLGLAFSQIKLDAPLYMQTGVLAGAPAVIDMKAEGFTPTFSIGAQYQLTDTTMLGLVYSSEDRFRLDGDADAAVFGLGPPIKSAFDTQVDIVWPQSFGGGIQQLIGDRQRVSCDVVWYDWSHAFDRVDMKFSNATNPLVPMLVGPTFGDSLPLKWDDGISVRVGYEFFQTPSDTWRFGYIHNTQNIPSSTLTPLLPATMEHSFTAGYGKLLWNGWRTDLAYQFAWSPDRTVGDSALVGDDFANSESRSIAHWVMVSFLRQF